MLTTQQVQYLGNIFGINVVPPPGQRGVLRCYADVVQCSGLTGQFADWRFGAMLALPGHTCLKVFGWLITNAIGSTSGPPTCETKLTKARSVGTNTFWLPN